MMNKLKKAICLTIVAIMCINVFVLAACKPFQGHVHNYSSDWSMDEQFHWKAPLCDDTDVLVAYGRHNTSGANGACTVCGYKAQVITPPVHQHTLSGWLYDDAEHYKTCTGDNCTEPADTRIENAAHNTNGADNACTICGYKAQVIIPPVHQHSLSGWQYDDTEHYKTCTGGNCTEPAGAQFENAVHNTAGQDNACTVCGYKATVNPPAHECGHVCDTCGKCEDADCENAACADKCQGHTPAHECGHVCDTCGKCTDPACENAACADKCQGHTLAHQHTLSGWQYDDAEHYKTCTGDNCTDAAGTKYEKGAHNTNAQDFSCTVCGYKAPVVVPPVSDPKIVAYRGYNESLYISFQENNPVEAKVYYKLENSNNWTEVDSPLIRATATDVARADAVGLVAGNYNLKVVTSSNYEIVLQNPVTVTAYDRSGYAHFNYNEGVGAYKDNGELKSGTLVIYLTEQNKNNVLDYVYLNGVKTDISKYMKGSDGTQYRGIGELLNNRRYSGDDRANVGIAKLCDIYGSVAVRILGKVTADVNADGTSTITGLTDYNSEGNGGSEGDNGRMARICNAKNLTIEGIGEDACVFGWGVHFIASEISYKSGRGKSFEVRNITFQNYPEDAVGMEGEQKEKKVTSEITFPVERCWVHNNVFLPGYCANPAENDKKEGDGSCDFKRGRYFTLSYNYFEDCHKTNLIGSADYSLQYCITMHHNWWNNCGSRIPLVRNSNVHFYNNYVFGDMSANPKPSLSYVHSVRANAYIFSEANYYDGCKEISNSSGGGVVKAYGNQYHSCFNGDISTIVDSRTQAVANNCKYTFGNVDYSSFDTNSALFYYNASTQTSDCLLDDAVTARIKVMRNAGVNGFGTNETDMLKVVPNTPVQLNGQGDTAIELKSGYTTVNGVVFTDSASLSKGVLKIRGQGIVFTLQSKATLTVTTDSVDDNAPDLIRSDGAVIAGKFTGTLTVTLEAGTYCITSGMKEKETIITALSFAQ